MPLHLKAAPNLCECGHFLASHRRKGAKPCMMDRCRCQAFAAVQSEKKRHKFNAKRTVVDGVAYASGREATRWGYLKMLAKAGIISELRPQVHYPLSTRTPDGARVVVGNYIADAVYVEDSGLVVEDAKGVRTALYNWKKRHMALEHGIQIREV